MADEGSSATASARPQPARPSDLVAVHALIERVEPGTWTTERLSAEIARPDSLCVWIGAGAFAVALGLGRVVVDELHVLDVAVDPTHRRRGAGRRIVDAMLVEAGRRDCRLALLELRESNRAARALYCGAGFVVVGRRPRYYPGGEAATLMTRSLTGPSVSPR